MFVRRLDFHASWGMLLAFGLVQGDQPVLPGGRRLPSGDSPGDGPAFWRLDIHERNLSGLTLTGWLIGRCRVDATPFHDVDLRGAALVSSEFEDCDFLRADLREVTLADSDFNGCGFTEADLRGADLRGATFIGGCSFRGADLSGALALEDQRDDLDLTEEQAASVRWSG